MSNTATLEGWKNLEVNNQVLPSVCLTLPKPLSLQAVMLRTRIKVLTRRIYKSGRFRQQLCTTILLKTMNSITNNVIGSAS
jgi:hypothetical protein